MPLKRQRDRQDDLIKNTFQIQDDTIVSFIADIYDFFITYGFSYLEVNPFTKDENQDIVCLDMVARLDTTEAYRQKHHWETIEFPHPFGSEKSEAEQYIDTLDASTGASLKFRILNPDGRIWLLTSGGGASVIIADTLADMGLASEVGNYGECSGNPDRESTRAYTLTLLQTMLYTSSLRGTKQSSKRGKKYLIIA